MKLRAYSIALVMITQLGHAAPAEFLVAACAIHVRATFVLFYTYPTPRASTHVCNTCEKAEPCLLGVIATTALMPWLLTLKACEFAAVCAFNLIARPCLVNVFLTLNVRAPECLRINIYLAR